MKYFLDTEFIESKDHLDLISIGIVAEDGRELYLENAETEWARASQWVLDNVRPHLMGGDALAERHVMVREIERFAGSDPEFWGYYASWDWTALCWLMGGMMNTPNGWPMYCRDLRQALDACGAAHIKQPDNALHHALSDARWVAEAYRLYAFGNVARSANP